MPTKKIVLSNDTVLLEILENSFFRRDGFEMVLIQDDQTCFQAVEAEAPTLAVLDLALLGEPTLECCQAIKQDSLLEATPVLLVLPEKTGEGLVDACWRAGCDAVVHRPLSAESFLDTVCGLIGISSRLAQRFPVSFHLIFLDSQQTQHVGSCVNVNVGGMFVETENLFPVDTSLAIEFTLPGFQGSLRCAVRVAWVNHPEWRKKDSSPCGIGLEFVDLSRTVKATLREFLDSLVIEE
jgi:CheY-like chemotaxis protein